MIAWAIVSAVVIVLLAWLRPVWLAAVMVAGPFILDLLANRGFVPTLAAAGLPDAALFCLTIGLALSRIRRPQAIRGGGRVVDIALGLLLVASILGIAVGREHPITTLLGLRTWFAHILAFYVLTNHDSLRPAGGTLFWIIWGLILIQPLPIFIQWYFPDCKNCYVDAYFGTLMSTATLAIVGGMAAGFSVAFYLERGQFRWFIPLVPMFAVLGLAEAKGGFAMAAGAMAAVVLAYVVMAGAARVEWRVPKALLVGGSLLVAGVQFASFNLGGDVGKAVFNPMALTEYGPVDRTSVSSEAGVPNATPVPSATRVSRAADLKHAWQAVRTQPASGWIGAGPGAGSEGSFPEYRGSIYRAVAARNGRSVFWVEGARLLVELGMLGVVATVILLGGLLGLAYRAYGVAVSQFERAVALVLVGQVAVIIVAYVYQTIREPPAVAMWMSASIAAVVCWRGQARW